MREGRRGEVALHQFAIHLSLRRSGKHGARDVDTRDVVVPTLRQRGSNQPSATARVEDARSRRQMARREGRPIDRATVVPHRRAVLVAIRSPVELPLDVGEHTVGGVRPTCSGSATPPAPPTHSDSEEAINYELRRPAHLAPRCASRSGKRRRSCVPTCAPMSRTCRRSATLRCCCDAAFGPELPIPA